MFENLKDAGNEITDGAIKKRKVISHCKSSFDRKSGRGVVKVTFDIEDCTNYEYECVFPKVPSDNYLGYLGIAVALECMLRQNVRGTIFSSSLFVINQLDGIFKMKELSFLPFYNFIKENTPTDILIEHKRSKDIKVYKNDNFYKYSKRIMDKDIMLKIENMMTDSLCLTVKEKHNLPEKVASKIETRIRKRYDLINGRKYAYRENFESTRRNPDDHFLSNLGNNNSTSGDNSDYDSNDNSEQDYNGDDNS